MTRHLSTFIRPENVVLSHRVETAQQVITLLAGKLQMGGFVHPGFAQAVCARERDMPTGLPLSDEFAVAVPHTDPEHVLRPTIALATLAHPVAFGSMDDPDMFVPVHVVFLLALQDKDAQIGVLQAIGEVLQDEARARLLWQAQTPQQALALLP
ncbi:PTS sugar transporter subunit IIA [Roseinatronobacter sp. NSM]|uniref:PTS sugar transporter subunit IIA n=1 Tax=Roseinatronobacter sp. NSM TaxID=3457785 RepID=UPI004035DDD9